MCVCVLTVNLVVWRQQPNVGEGDAACVTVVKLHCDQIILLIDIGTSCWESLYML